MTTQAQENFLNNYATNGGWLNPDNFAGAQCKDVPDAYALALWGDWINTVRPGNGKDVFQNASPDYFVKVANDQANPDQVPPRGAIVSWEGTAAVPEGHVNLVLSADARHGQFLEQNGYTQRGIEVNTYPWELPGGAQPIGWLIPRLEDGRPDSCLVDPGDSLGSIADQYGVTVQAILDCNPWIENPNVIQPGWELTLP